MPFTIRTIIPSDNPVLAKIIRQTLEEFGANHPGTVYFDESTDQLFELFQQEKSRYFVAEKEESLLGGAGIFPTPGLEADTCELVKMYLLPQARGQGLGRTLIQTALAFAREAGYRRVYLETMPELEQAIRVYEKFGFAPLQKPMGNSGHSGCSKWMLLNLKPG